MCQEYSAQFQNLDDNQYYHQIDQAQELQYSIPVTPYDQPISHNPPQNPPQGPLRSTEDLRQLIIVNSSFPLIIHHHVHIRRCQVHMKDIPSNKLHSNNMPNQEINHLTKTKEPDKDLKTKLSRQKFRESAFHLSSLQSSASIGTIPTLYVIQRDRH